MTSPSVQRHTGPSERPVQSSGRQKGSHDFLGLSQEAWKWWAVSGCLCLPNGMGCHLSAGEVGRAHGGASHCGLPGGPDPSSCVGWTAPMAGSQGQEQPPGLVLPSWEQQRRAALSPASCCTTAPWLSQPPSFPGDSAARQWAPSFIRAQQHFCPFTVYLRPQSDILGSGSTCCGTVNNERTLTGGMHLMKRQWGMKL